MNSSFDIQHDQITLRKQLLYHFYPGVLITLFYVFSSKEIIQLGYPGLAALLLAEILVLTPVGTLHMLIKGKALNGKFSLRNVITLKEKLSVKQYIGWSLLGIVFCFLIFIPTYPVGLFFRENLFSWLPEWYFNPGYGTNNTELVAKVFLIGILTDGIIAPVVEELYFRGYLLPRMAYLKKWAPVVNGALFGLYHFWQPHNFIGIVAIGIILSYIVWKKRNVYLGIIIHCTINILGAIGGYLAASNGVLIER